MKKVDTDKVWRGKPKTEKLEMKGFSTPHPDTPIDGREPIGLAQPNKQKVAKQPRYRDTRIPNNHGTTKPRYHDTIIEIIRKAVKEFGKEAATHRFTITEKKAIAELIFRYKAKDIKTSENEITRIAVNFILQDHKENGRISVLEKALKALNK